MNFRTDTIGPMGRPPKGSEAGKIRSIRIVEELWNAARQAAAARDQTITGVITDFLRWYVGEPGMKMPRRSKSADSGE